MSNFRRSYNDFGHGDDHDFRTPNRWDRDRFERVRAKSRPRERDSFKLEEDDRYGPRGGHRDIEIDERFDRRGPRSGREERDRFFEDDRWTSPRRSKFEFAEEDRYRSGKEIAPYMHRYEREPPPRPSNIRRRSSWDTFDRPPYQDSPRYDDRGGDRQNNDLRLNIRVGSPHEHDDSSRSARHDHDDRRRDRLDERIEIDERGRYGDGRRRDRFDERIDIDERDRHGDDRRIEISERRYDEPRYYREPEPRYYRDNDWRDVRDHRDYEDYNGARIIRERERTIDRRARSPVREVESPHREHESREFEEKETYEFKEEVKEERPPGTRKGKTRMPKRLVHKRAILDLGYPFEEEEDFYVVRLALAKDQIDECIKISETFKEQEKTTYSYEYEATKEETKEETKAIEAPPEPESEFVETVTRKVIENPTEDDYERFRASGPVEEVHGESEHIEHGSEHGSEHEDLKSVHSHRARARSEHGAIKSPSPTRERHRSRSVKRHRSKSGLRSKSRRHRSKSRRRSRRDSDDYRETRVVEYSSDDDARGKGRLELVMPDRTHRKGKDPKAEIKALEAERRALKHERDAEDRRRRGERYRDYSSDSEGEVRIEKDRRGRLSLVKSND